LSGPITFNVVGFVRNENDWLATPSQQLRDLSISRIWSSCSIHKKQNEVGGVYGDARLVLHPDLNRITDRRLHSTCIHHAKAHLIPFDNPDQPISSGTRTIFNDCTPLSDKAIEERAFPDVGATYERDQRQPLRR
jgi:hypothetical protein